MDTPDRAGASISLVLRELWGTLPSDQRRRLLALTALVAIAGVLEMIGIAALLPLISIFQRPERIAENQMFSSLNAALGLPTHDNFILIMLVALFGYYLVKNVFLVLLDGFQYRSLAAIQADWARKLMGSYLNRDYSYHLRVNSALLIRNVTSEVSTVLYYVLVPATSLLAEAFVIGFLLALLVYMDPLVASFFLAVGGAFLGLFYRAFQQRSYQIGESLRNSSANMIQHAKEGFGGIKEIKVMGREPFFAESFGGHVKSYTEAWSRSLVLYKLPTHLIEFVFVTIFAGLLALLTFRHSPGSAFPLLAVYAATAFRLIPSLNRIVTSLNLIKQGSASAQVLCTELLHLGPAGETVVGGPFPLSSEIRISGLSFRHQGADQDTLLDVSLTIPRGAMIGFAGKSGAGKTTLIDCVIGLLTPGAGTIEVDGRNIQGNLPAWQKQIGYIPQHIYLLDDSLRHNIALGLRDEEIDSARVAKAVLDAQLSELVDSLPEGLDTKVGEHGVRLSGGQRQRIGIARALYHDPVVLVMDEATSALDAATEQAIVTTVSGLKGSRTILVIAHRLASMEACDKVVHMSAGRVQAQ